MRRDVRGTYRTENGEISGEAVRMAKPTQNGVWDMWYVIWTETRTETVLKEEIENKLPKDLYKKCWLPEKKEQQKWNGEFIEVKKILFPGYLFIDTDSPEKVHLKIRKIKPNARVMKTGEEFTPISTEEEDIIRSITGDTGIVGISTGIIEEGKLKVIDGPLKGLEKYIIKIDRYKRKAWLKIRLLGEDRCLTMSLSVIRKS